MMEPYIGQLVLANVSGLLGYDGSAGAGSYISGTIVDINVLDVSLTVSLDHGVFGVNRVTLPITDVTALF